MIGSRLPGAVFLLLVVFGLGWALAGGPLLLLWCAAGVAVGFALMKWMSAALALAATIAGLLVLELLLLRTSAALGNNALPVELIVWGVIGAGASGCLLFRPPRPLDRQRGMLALAVAIGPAITVVLATLVSVLPNALHLAWAMNRDAVRDLVVSRSMLEHGGIAAEQSQPTPLPFGIVASNLAPGRGEASDLLRFDVTRLAEVWALVIVVTCLLLSAIAAQVLRRARPGIAIALVICAGLAGLSWWVAGIQFAGGFLNAGFGIILLLAGWLAFLASEARPFGATAVLVLAAVAMLAVWSPLVVCLLGLAAVAFWRALFAGRSRRTVVVVLGIAALFTAYAVTVTLPLVLASSADLASDGYFPDFASPIVAAVGLIFLVIAAVDRLRSGHRHQPIGAIVLAITVVLGTAYLLFIRRHSPDAWGYYPEKFAWMASIVLIVAGVSLVAAALQDRPALSHRQVASVSGAVIAVLIIAAGLRGPAGLSHDFPAAGLLHGEVAGITNREAEQVFALLPEGSAANAQWVQYYLAGIMAP